MPLTRPRCVKSVTCAALLTFTVALAGCAGPGPGGYPQDAGRKADAPAEPKRATTVEAALPTELARVAPLPRPKPAYGAQNSSAETGNAFPNPNTLVGLSPHETHLRLGEPTVVREDPPATIWTYHAGPCVLSLYLYSNVKTRELRVLAFDAATPATDVPDPARCFADPEFVRRGR